MIESELRESTVEIQPPDEGLSAQEQLDYVIEQVQMRLEDVANFGKMFSVGQDPLKVIYTDEEVDLLSGQYGLSHGHGGCQAGIFEYSLEGVPLVQLAHVLGGTPEKMVRLVRQIIDRGGNVSSVTLFAIRGRDMETMVSGLGRLVGMVKIRYGLVDTRFLDRSSNGTYGVWVYHDKDGNMVWRLTTESRYRNEMLPITLNQPDIS